MTKKFIWLVLSCLIVAAMILGSCKAAVEEEAPVVPEEEEEEEAPVVTPPTEEEEEEEEEEVVVPAGPEMGYNSVGVLQEVPQYGGTIYISLSAGHIDGISPRRYMGGYGIKHFIYDPTFVVDWTRGPAGTGENPFDGRYNNPEFLVPHFVETYECIDEYVEVFTIRKDMVFQNKAPAWGRAVTGEDVLRAVELCQEAPWSGGRYINPATPMEDRAKYELLDEYTIRYTATGTWPLKPSPYDLLLWLYPPELIEQEAAEGELAWEWDWQYACGTGPFILKDFVEDSAYELVRNDTHWYYDPLWPENQLPYVDRVVGLDIPDTAVYHSALQTGKLDLGRLSWDKAKTFRQQVPDMLEATGAPSGVDVVYFQESQEPYSDVMVRRALHLAFDNQKMLNEYYGGFARLMDWPIRMGVEGYTPFEELPQAQREIYEHHPDKAKELLTEAGYPNGFKAEITVNNVRRENLALILADDWAEIGVDLTVTMLDGATYGGQLWAKTYPGMTLGYRANAGPNGWARFCGGQYPPAWDAFSVTVDPLMEEEFTKWKSLVLFEELEERAAMWREACLRVMLLCHVVYIPTPNTMVFWWPWLKNFNGMVHLGLSMAQGENVMYKYLWIDRDLKYEMVGTRD